MLIEFVVVVGVIITIFLVCLGIFGTIVEDRDRKKPEIVKDYTDNYVPPEVEDIWDKQLKLTIWGNMSSEITVVGRGSRRYNPSNGKPINIYNKELYSMCDEDVRKHFLRARQFMCDDVVDWDDGQYSTNIANIMSWDTFVVHNERFSPHQDWAHRTRNSRGTSSVDARNVHRNGERPRGYSPSVSGGDPGTGGYPHT